MLCMDTSLKIIAAEIKQGDVKSGRLTCLRPQIIETKDEHSPTSSLRDVLHNGNSKYQPYRFYTSQTRPPTHFRPR
jgi:hypothetical protein